RTGARWLRPRTSPAVASARTVPAVPRLRHQSHDRPQTKLQSRPTPRETAGGESCPSARELLGSRGRDSALLSIRCCNARPRFVRKESWRRRIADAARASLDKGECSAFEFRAARLRERKYRSWNSTCRASGNRETPEMDVPGGGTAACIGIERRPSVRRGRERFSFGGVRRQRRRSRSGTDRAETRRGAETRSGEA